MRLFYWSVCRFCCVCDHWFLSQFTWRIGDKICRIVRSRSSFHHLSWSVSKNASESIFLHHFLSNASGTWSWFSGKMNSFQGKYGTTCFQFASTDVVITALMEFFPRYANRRYILVIVACILFYIFSLPFACPVSRARIDFLNDIDRCLGRNLSFYTLSRIHGEYFIGDDRLFWSYHHQSHIRLFPSIDFHLSFQWEILFLYFRFQSIHERRSDDVRKTTGWILFVHHFVHHRSTVDTGESWIQCYVSWCFCF